MFINFKLFKLLMSNIDVGIFRKDLIRYLMRYNKIFSKILNKKLILGIKELKSCGPGIYEIKFRDEDKLLFLSFIFDKNIDEKNSKTDFLVAYNSISKIRLYSGNNDLYNLTLKFFQDSKLTYSTQQFSKSLNNTGK